jgi:hypothetical protein
MAQGTTRGVPIDIDPLLAADSDLLVPSQKAIKTYADTKISSVSATSPMVSTGGTSPTLSIPQATSSADGYLSSTDWTTFNNKQNALGYTPFKFVQTSQTAHTGTVAETVIATATINGGTFNSSDILKTLFGINKTGILGVYSLRLKINTSNTLTGATQIGLFTSAGTSAQQSIMSRNFSLNGGNLYGYSFTGNAITDIANIGGTLSSTAYNTANTLYFFFTVQLVNATDSITPNLTYISN